MSLVEGRRYIAVPTGKVAADGRWIYSTVCGDEGARRITVPSGKFSGGLPVAM
jgi:hypothetical protein